MGVLSMTSSSSSPLAAEPADEPALPLAPDLGPVLSASTALPGVGPNFWNLATKKPSTLVDDIPARLAVVVDGVNGSKQQLLLGVRDNHEVLLRLVGLDTRVLGNNTSSGARRIEQNPVEATDGLGELAGIVVAHNNVPAAQTVDVTDQTLGTRLAHIVGEDATRVAHQGGHVRRLTTGGGRHIEHTLVLLGGQGHDGEEGGGGLDNVVTGEVLGGGTQWHVALEDLQADLGPLADGLEGDTTVNQGAGQVSAVRAQSVCPDDKRSAALVGLEELECLRGAEEVVELLGHVLRVAVVREVLQNPDVFRYPAAEELQIRSQHGLLLGCQVLFLVVLPEHHGFVATNICLQGGFLQLRLCISCLFLNLPVELPRQSLNLCGLAILLFQVRVAKLIVDLDIGVSLWLGDGGGGGLLG
ncbi:hypothetical protein VP1G_11449 [Cytospora mali]|uniref:Uncharacterized protein n=1 Tax=Cytospora mali TaxID=578113 RepID=A0A194VH51_CYTMA|nr:hypothetical protein VP1G_11449 [Valsa mali var. pyri (nom. inval.)]